MLEPELRHLVDIVCTRHSESQTIELKAAEQGCPTRLYDTLSSFSNQNSGGIIIFGIDEKQDYKIVGVYDAQDLQKHVMEQCEQMHPKVRAIFTICNFDDKLVVSAEIPGMDVSDRPCFYVGKGRNGGSYVRVGDADRRMTEYEIYSYEAFRKNYEDELRPVDRADINDLDTVKLQKYLLAVQENRPNLAKLPEKQILNLMGITTKEGKPTIAGIMFFAVYPQAFFPQLRIIATHVPGTAVGELSDTGERFLDSKGLDGTLLEQLQEALEFVGTNTKTSISISDTTGERVDMPDYPIGAVRELVMNALIHRDYSIHTQGMPVQLQIFSNRMVISNPGGLYGRLSIDELGQAQPVTRNPTIVSIMELLGITENRYSGIPTVRRIMRENGQPEPVFENRGDEFIVTLYPKTDKAAPSVTTPTIVRHPLYPGHILPDKGLHLGFNYFASDSPQPLNDDELNVLRYCSIPRTRQEIIGHLGLKSKGYAVRKYIQPLADRGLLLMSKPNAPSSKNQIYQTPAAVLNEIARQ
ncbi:MAG: putative DNA binding domain-containing protein [Bifidobacterium sp.]|nr:putative DNA binding domain-containing protein [Bifidobacterium sp.]